MQVVVTEDIGRQILTYGHRCALWEAAGGGGKVTCVLNKDVEVGLQKAAL